MRQKLLSILALLCLTAASAWADATYDVALADGTTDAAKWQAKAGDGDFGALPLEGVAAGTTVTLKYTGDISGAM